MRYAAVLVCLVLAAGCGSGGSDDLKVSAASSLEPPFTELGGANFSFAGSDQPAAQIPEGAVDAGFVYVTDVNAAGGRAKAIELPAALEPDVTYEAAVVKGSKQVGRARAFIDGLLSGKGAAALRRAGFAPPPG